MVPAAERAELRRKLRALDALVLHQDRLEPLLEPGPAQGRGRTRRGILVVPARSVANRHLPLDLAADGREAVRQVVRCQAGAYRHHPAADVDPDRGRNNRAFRRNDGADRRAAPEMHVRHDGKVRVHERQPGNIFQLLTCGLFERHAFYPGLDTAPGEGLEHFKLTHLLAVCCPQTPPDKPSARIPLGEREKKTLRAERAEGGI